jgi:hypothetical protein
MQELCKQNCKGKGEGKGKGKGKGAEGAEQLKVEATK